MFLQSHNPNRFWKKPRKERVKDIVLDVMLPSNSTRCTLYAITATRYGQNFQTGSIKKNIVMHVVIQCRPRKDQLPTKNQSVTLVLRKSIDIPFLMLETNYFYPCQSFESWITLIIFFSQFSTYTLPTNTAALSITRHVLYPSSSPKRRGIEWFFTPHAMKFTY